MRVFVTGATGYIGSAVVRELIDAGHEVVGLARSDGGAAELTKAGAQVQRGDLEDLDSLRRGASSSDGVIHLAFIHIMTRFAESLAVDLRAVEAMGSVLVGSNKPLVVTAHAGGTASEDAVLGLAPRGVRSVVVSLCPTVHGEGDSAFIPQLIAIAKKAGFSAYVGDGATRWPAVHRLDAAHLYRLALESAPAGSKLDGVGDEGVPFRTIAEIIGNHLGVPVKSISAEEAGAHFGFLGQIVSRDLAKSSAKTQELLGWKPVQIGLVEDLERGHYFNP